ncbi:MAG TPA: neutral zinc metallopeptidase [Thermoleophilaceae bacterium]
MAACGGSNSPSTAATTPTGTGGSAGAAKPSTIEGDALNRMPVVPGPSGSPPALSGHNATDVRAYLRAVFSDAQGLWRGEFASAGQQYTPARLTLFSQSVKSGCGAQDGVGPFYCSANHGIYLDLGFMKALTQRFGIGAFAQAYVVGHEFGHHIQNLTGILHRRVLADQQDPAGKNERSVRFELQADCLAGVWAHSAYQRAKITDSDITAALHAAQLIGDDLQQHISGNAIDSGLWTHGSSQQRQQWFITGFDKGDPGACNTFTPASV